MGIIIRQTARLILTPFYPQDAEGFFALNQDPHVLQFTGDTPFTSLEQAQDFIHNYDHYAKYGFGRWTVRRAVDRQYLGFCGLRYDAAHSQVDLGFRLARRFWGQGYAYEAALAALDLGFNHYQLAVIYANAMTENHASLHLLHKLAFVPVVAKANADALSTDRNSVTPPATSTGQDEPIWRKFSLTKPAFLQVQSLSQGQ